MAAGIVNSVYRATRTRVRSLPISIEPVLAQNDWYATGRGCCVVPQNYSTRRRL